MTRSMTNTKEFYSSSPFPDERYTKIYQFCLISLVKPLEINPDKPLPPLWLHLYTNSITLAKQKASALEVDAYQWGERILTIDEKIEYEEEGEPA